LNAVEGDSDEWSVTLVLEHAPKMAPKERDGVETKNTFEALAADDEDEVPIIMKTCHQCQWIGKTSSETCPKCQTQGLTPVGDADSLGSRAGWCLPPEDASHGETPARVHASASKEAKRQKKAARKKLQKAADIKDEEVPPPPMPSSVARRNRRHGNVERLCDPRCPDACGCTEAGGLNTADEAEIPSIAIKAATQSSIASKAEAATPSIANKAATRSSIASKAEEQEIMEPAPIEYEVVEDDAGFVLVAPLDWAEPLDELNVASEAFEECEVEVTIDCGAVDHVGNQRDFPGLPIRPSPGSMHNKHFLGADGSIIENEGEKEVCLQDTESRVNINSIFQMANVTRALFSVSKVCDQGAEVNINKHRAVITKEGKTVATFNRQRGLYVATMRLKRPKMKKDPVNDAGFTGPGKA